MIELDFDAFGFEVAAVIGEKEHSLRALVFPVQDHFEFGLGYGRYRKHGGKADGCRDGDRKEILEGCKG